MDPAEPRPPFHDPHPVTGLLGGSFNPPHMGHVLLAVAGLCAAGLEEVWLAPAWEHPFGKPLAPFEERLAMCRLAVEPLGPRVKVDPIERDIHTPGKPSYTVRTVEALIAGHPGRAFRLLVGSDLAGEISTWRESERLLSLAPPLIIPRLGREGGEGPHTLPAISATAVRERIAAGADLRGWVPLSVARHIQSRGLYGARGETIPR